MGVATHHPTGGTVVTAMNWPHLLATVVAGLVGVTLGVILWRMVRRPGRRRRGTGVACRLARSSACCLMTRPRRSAGAATADRALSVR